LISINKATDKVEDLDRLLSKMFEIPVEKLVVLIKHENIMSSSAVRTELFNIEWRKPMTIANSSRLDHGQVLYIEEGELKGKLEDKNWHKEF
jgi:hypothetical protein